MELRDVAAPTAADLSEGKVLAQFLCGGICGSDAPFFYGEPGSLGHAGDAGFPLHEVVGRVLETTSPTLQVGDRVVGYATSARGLSEYFVNDAAQLIAVDSGLSDSELVVAQPLATVMCALAKLSIVKGAYVAVIGLGPIGVTLSQMLKAAGAARVVGVDRLDRLELSGRFGIDEVIWSSSSNWAESLGSERPGIVVEAVGHQVGTLNDAIAAVGFGGHIVAFGVPDDPYYPLAFEELFRKNASMTTGTTDDWQTHLTSAWHYLEDNPWFARELVTHRFPVAKAQRAFECGLSPVKGRLKVVVEA
jgi:threonine dehydrogenase-like Zn-dependent dehydrogenase